MIIAIVNKVHVMYRVLYETAIRRHFIGEVLAAEGAVCQLQGYAFIYDSKLSTFVRKPEIRSTIIDLAESGYIVNVIDSDVDVEKVSYKYVKDAGLIATDGKGFVLNINEFSTKS